MISKKFLKGAGFLAIAGVLNIAYADSPLISLGDDASVYGLLTAAATYNDNVYLYKSNKDGDVLFRISPGFEFIKGESAESTLRIRFVEDLIYYMSESDNNTQLENFSLSYRYNGSKLIGTVSAGLNRTQQNTNRDQNANTRAGVVVRSYNYYANALGDYMLGEKLSVSSGFKWNGITFDNRRSEYNDRQSYSIPATLYYAVTEKMRVGLSYEYRYTDLASNSKNKSVGYAPGLQYVHFAGLSATGGLTEKLSLSGRIGYTTSRYDRRVRLNEDWQSTLGLSLSAYYRATEKTSLSLSASRDFEISNIAADGSIISTGLMIGVNHIQTEHWTVNGSFSYRQDAYQDYNRTDDVYTLQAGCGYAINEYVSFTASYAFQCNRSDASNYGYTANTLTLALICRY